MLLLRRRVAWPIIYDVTSTRLRLLAPLVRARLPGMCTTSTALPLLRRPRVPHRLQRPALRDASKAERLLMPHVLCGSRRLRPPGRGLFARVDRRTDSLQVRVYQRFVDVRGLGLCPRFASTIPCCQPGPFRAAHARRRRRPVFLAVASRGRTALRHSRGFARPRVITAARFCVAATTLVVHQTSPGSLRLQAFVVFAWRGPTSRGSSAASSVDDAAFLPNDDDYALSDDIAVSSPPLDAGSFTVVLPGSLVSPISAPSPPASVDEAVAVLDEPDDVPEQPVSDAVTLQMPPDHTRLLEDQARLLLSLLRDPPSDEP
ncbi:hypothetical protein MRX96_042206 [Rhipicephalus microplus]